MPSTQFTCHLFASCFLLASKLLASCFFTFTFTLVNSNSFWCLLKTLNAVQMAHEVMKGISLIFRSLLPSQWAVWYLAVMIQLFTHVSYELRLPISGSRFAVLGFAFAFLRRSDTQSRWRSALDRRVHSSFRVRVYVLTITSSITFTLMCSMFLLGGLEHEHSKLKGVESTL